MPCKARGSHGPEGHLKPGHLFFCLSPGSLAKNLALGIPQFVSRGITTEVASCRAVERRLDEPAKSFLAWLRLRRARFRFSS
jgi:hypothetical protein